METLSIRDINFIRHFYIYLNIFLITPWYDFEKNAFYKPKLQTFYGIFLLLLTTIRVFYILLEKNVYTVYDQLLRSQKFAWFTFYVLITSISLVAILKICFVDQKEWKLLLTNLQYIDTKLKNKGKVEKNPLKRFYFTLFLKHVFFVAITVLETSVWYTIFQFPIVQLLLFSATFEGYIEYLIIVLVQSLVQSLEIRYIDLNKRAVKISRNKKISQLRSLTHDFRILGQTVDIFNKLFGYHIILILWHFGVEMVSCLTFAFVPYISTDAHNYFNCGLVKLCIFFWLSVSSRRQFSHGKISFRFSITF